MNTSPLAPCLVMIAVFVGLFDALRNEPRAAAPAAVRLRSALVRHDTSPPLRDLVKKFGPPAANSVGALPARSSALLRRRATGLTLDQNFPGMTAPGGPIPTVPASDTTGAAGPNHYMQAVNFSAAIYNKTGTLVLGPFSTGQFFTGFPPCGGGWSDVIVLYDHAAQRFIVSRFAPQDTSVNPPIDWFQCFAVSQTSDPTGPYFRYAFSIQDPVEFNDYPKFGIWPDAYYLTADRDRIFPGKGVFVAAFERAPMLINQPAQSFVMKIDNGGFRAGMLPSDWDGRTAPPSGSPNYFVRTLDSNIGWPTSVLEVWAFQVDWPNGTGSFTLRDSLTPAAFDTSLCGLNNQSCVPQPGTTQGLDPQAVGRPMMRLAYRNFGDHEALTFNHAVDAGDFADHSAIRWYELRKTGNSPWSFFQQSTFSPDSDHRFMGSIAFDRAGNMALGYSISSGSLFPSIRIAGRLAGDPLGAMTEEFTLQAGSGSQTATSQWADYSHMALDPLDDCTFWYTGTFQPVTSNQLTWATQIGSFRFPDCTADLAVTKSRAPSGFIEAGTNVTYTIALTNNGPADAGNVTLTDAVPAGTSFVSLASPSGWTCTAPPVGSSGAISCTTMIFDTGTTATFTVVATVNCNVPNATSIANTASVSATTPPDPNGGNNSSSASFTVNNPVPVVTAAVVKSLLPQNNHSLENVGLSASATDGACPAPTTLVVQIFSSEDDQTTPSNSNFSPDAKDIAVKTLRLRQERDSSGDGRVYLIVVSATDTAGGTGFATRTVVVPKSSSPANTAAVNALAAAAKAFADANSGAPPAGYVLVGDGPIVGPKQ